MSTHPNHDDKPKSTIHDEEEDSQDEDYLGDDISDEDSNDDEMDEDEEEDIDGDLVDYGDEPHNVAMDAGLYSEGDEDGSQSMSVRASFLAGANELTDIGALMKAVGPHCKCVKLLADGTSIELVLDMTPKLNSAARELGGKAGFVGQFTDINVVVMCIRDAPESISLNAHTLPAPLNELTGRDAPRGDLLLLRMNDDAEPEDFTLDEWNQFIDLVDQGKRETHNRARESDSSSSSQSTNKKQMKK